MFDFWHVADDVAEIEWRRFVLKCKDTVTGETADESRCTFDFVNYTSGTIDPTWTSADYSNAAGRIWNIATMWAPHMSSNHSFFGIDAYRMKFEPAWEGSSLTNKDLHPFVDTGPPEYVFKANMPGGVSTAIAPQLAFSVTEGVGLRRNWGRFYLPFPTAAVHSGTTGRFLTTLVDEVATKVHDEYAAAGGGEIFPVVPVTQASKQRVASLAQVMEIRADDVPDVIRRRRFSHAVYRKIVPIPA